MPAASPPHAGRGAAARWALTRRPAVAWTLTVVLLPATVALAQGGPLDTGLTSALLVLLLEVVVVAVVGGFVVAVVAAVAAVLLANWFLVPPFRTLVVASTDDVVALVVFVAVALAASGLVAAVTSAQSRATAADAEADVLRGSVDTPADEADPTAVLERILTTFDINRAELRDASDTVLASAEQPGPGGHTLVVALPGGARLVTQGPDTIGSDRRILTALANAALRAHETRQLATQAARASELAAADRAKSALLAGVGHDLRTPIAAIKVAADALTQPDIEWTDHDRAELIGGITLSADRLDELVSNLLDMSRIEAGALAVTLAPTALDGVAATATLGLVGEPVEVAIPDDLPLVMCDPVLLERVLANLLSNAHRFAPAGTPVSIGARLDGDQVLMSVVDHGPGVRSQDQRVMFDPFQRLGDRSPGGTGVGLAVARAFTESMGGTLTPSETRGGGLTMTVGLPVASTSQGSSP